MEKTLTDQTTTGNVGAKHRLRAGVPTGGFSATGVSMAIGGDGTGNRWIGVITSHVVYDSYLSIEDCVRAEGWVAHTLARNSLLSAGRPYRSTAPRLQ